MASFSPIRSRFSGEGKDLARTQIPLLARSLTRLKYAEFEMTQMSIKLYFPASASFL